MLLYERLADDLSTLIADGRVLPGERLPSVRLLSAQRRLSVSTVVQALRTLETRGLVEARPQSGYYVRRRATQHLPAGRGKARGPVAVSVTARLIDILRDNEAAGMVPLGSALPAPSLLCGPAITRLYARVARQRPNVLDGSSHTDLNEPALVRAIVRRSVETGGAVTADELVVTQSCSEALALCLSVVTRPGDTVAVESPTYYVMLQMLEQMGLRALELPTHPQTGVSLDALDLATREGKVAACLLIPNGGNPLGSVMPDAHKQQLAALMAQRKVAVIEDDIYGDLCQGAVRPRPLHAFDAAGNTLLCTSLSKTVSPALRLGYVAAGRRSGDILLAKTLMSGRTNPLTQQVIAEFMESRGFDAHLRRLRRELARQTAQVRDAVLRHFPAGTRVSDPQGGFVLWLELPRGVDGMALHREAAIDRIAFVPGELFAAGNRYRNCIRLACGHPFDARMEAAIARLGELAGRQARRAT